MSRLFAILVTLFLLITAFPVFAKETTTSGSLRKERQASKEAAFKAKLQAFKNKEKAIAAARVSDNLNMINQKQTSQMQKFLTTMSGILDKLEARVNQETPAISSARETWASASAEIASQAQKDYTLEVSSELKIKTEAKSQRDKLHSDLKEVRKLVTQAKQAISNAIRTAKEAASSEP